MSKLNTEDREILNNFKGMTVGQILVKARKKHGYDLEQIAAHLNIGTPHLEAIEADDKASLPPQVYAVGFVRAYADVLGLDSEKMAYLFKIQSYGVKKTEEQKQITTKRQGETISTKAIVAQKMESYQGAGAGLLLAAFGLACVVGVLWFLVWLIWPNSSDVEANPIPEVSDVIAPPQPIEPEETFVETEATEIVPTEPMQVVVRPDEGRIAFGADMMESDLALKAIAESWVEIRSALDRKVLLTRTLQTGDVFYAPRGTDVLVTSGNAGGVEVFLDGKSLGVLGKPSEIIRLRALSVDALRLQNAE